MNEYNSNIRFLSAISYISVLFIVGHFSVERDNPDVRFHKYQGFVTFMVFHVLYLTDFILFMILSFSSVFQAIITLLLTIAISIAYIFMTIIGIMSAIKFKQTVLPFSVGFMAVRLRETVDHKLKS